MCVFFCMYMSKLIDSEVLYNFCVLSLCEQKFWGCGDQKFSLATEFGD